MGLVLKDKLELQTPLGPRQVQLLVGDITKLPLEEKVDFIFISAYRGDYTPVWSTLIGSLYRNLSITVRDLAKNKEMDLWRNFSCWVSAPLPENSPYRRVVCFEYNMNVGTLMEQLSQIFRAMVPVFNNTEATVITPLLATGNQGHCPFEVLEGMVNGACEWIKAGLPLHCLKIVLFSRDTSEISAENLQSMKQFAELKDKWESWEYFSEDPCQYHDVLLSFAHEDKELAEKVKEALETQNPCLSVQAAEFQFDHSLVWQAQIYNSMKLSKKIIVLLTPSYIENSECLEQFNMALCCNRLKKEEVVVPFYVKTVEFFPSYISMVQYVDCRNSKSGELDMHLLSTASSDIIKSLEPDMSPLYDNTDQPGIEALKVSREVLYDVFISYSHRHRDEPEKLCQILKKDYSDLKVFFDKEELKAGNLWQQALYEAIDKARCVVAFLAPGYIQSFVCNEEFNIALARHYAHDSIFLFPANTGALEVIPRSLTSVAAVDLREEGSVARLADKLTEMLAQNQGKRRAPLVNKLKMLLAHKRELDFKKRFKNYIIKQPLANSAHKLKGEIVFSYAQDSLKLAAIMSTILMQEAPKLTCHMKASSHSERRRHLDKADITVIFISDQYVFSQSLVEELHTCLSRQRMERDRTLFYLVQCNHMAPTPTYFHVLPFSISLNDKLWTRMPGEDPQKDYQYHVNLDGMEGTYRCSTAQRFALIAAVQDVLVLLSQSARGQGSAPPHNIVNIFKVENEVSGKNDDPVDANTNVISLTSVSHVVSQGQAPCESLNHDAVPESDGASVMNDDLENKLYHNPVYSYDNSRHRHETCKTCAEHKTQVTESSPPEGGAKMEAANHDTGKQEIKDISHSSESSPLEGGAELEAAKYDTGKKKIKDISQVTEISPSESGTKVETSNHDASKRVPGKQKMSDISQVTESLLSEGGAKEEEVGHISEYVTEKQKTDRTESDPSKNYDRSMDHEVGEDLRDHNAQIAGKQQDNGKNRFCKFCCIL